MDHTKMKSSSLKKGKITLEGKCIEIDMLNEIDSKDWIIGNVVVIYNDEGTSDCEDSCCEFSGHEDCQDYRRFVIDKNGVPFSMNNKTIPLSFTKKFTNASQFYEYSKFYIEIGIDDIWALENYKKSLPENVYFTFFYTQFIQTNFDLNNKKLPFKSNGSEKNQYSVERKLSYEEIMILSRYFKDPKKGHAYQFKINFPFTHINTMNRINYFDEMILSKLPKGWALGKYKMEDYGRYYIYDIELFGSKTNQEKILTVIESIYHDSDNISYMD